MSLVPFPKRVSVSLYSCRFVPGSVRVGPFGAHSHLRKGVVTASKAPEILSIGYSTRYKAMRMLSGIVDEIEENEEDSFVQNAKKHGLTHEEDAARKFMELFGDRYQAIGDTKKQVTYRGQFDNFYLSATPDLLLYNKLTHKLELLEIKCPYLAFCKQSKVCDEPIKPNHYVQCQTQMLVTGIDSSYLMLYVPDKDGTTNSNISIWKIDRDASFQKFILLNVRQAMTELKDDITRWKTFRGEGVYNRQACIISMSTHVSMVEL